MKLIATILVKLKKSGTNQSLCCALLVHGNMLYRKHSCAAH